MEGKLKMLKTNQKFEEIVHVYRIFCALGTSIAMSLKGNDHI